MTSFCVLKSKFVVKSIGYFASVCSAFRYFCMHQHVCQLSLALVCSCLHCTILLLMIRDYLFLMCHTQVFSSPHTRMLC